MIPLFLLAASLSAQVPSHAIYSWGRVLTLEACEQKLEIRPYGRTIWGSVVIVIAQQCVPVVYSTWWSDEYFMIATPAAGRTSILPTYIGIRVVRYRPVDPRMGMATFTSIPGAVVFSRWCYDALRWRACP